MIVAGALMWIVGALVAGAPFFFELLFGIKIRRNPSFMVGLVVSSIGVTLMFIDIYLDLYLAAISS